MFSYKKYFLSFVVIPIYDCKSIIYFLFSKIYVKSKNNIFFHFPFSAQNNR